MQKHTTFTPGLTAGPLKDENRYGSLDPGIPPGTRRSRDEDLEDDDDQLEEPENLEDDEPGEWGRDEEETLDPEE
ncbi:hypothetical protein [Chitinophaga vietnamensis]|uniref:hypothetical protein n=1 Tax=Chitinophaga vietnamensis TaxID=2593957 RepID=UPI0011787D5B|nr:hypothetical protein [Chitinophaga vietnamensis]